VVTDAIMNCHDLRSDDSQTDSSNIDEQELLEKSQHFHDEDYDEGMQY
jgi:hypothetical protein